MKTIIPFCLLLLITLSSHIDREDWGFFGHRKINRHAVFSLPSEMTPFYKKNIEYLTEHAVDPDKRRYATKHEAHRHYIDIDHWGEYPFPELPRNFIEALMKYTDIYAVNAENDTLHLFGNEVMSIKKKQITLLGSDIKKAFSKDSINIDRRNYRAFYTNVIHPLYYRDEKSLSCDSLTNSFLTELGLPLDCQSIYAVDSLSEYGIAPWHLISMQNRLTKAFKSKDAEGIIRISADFGHYVGDAHVPLHTTKNYNGQLTGQTGIHGFWESRLLELFSDEYDYILGPAEYIENPKDFVWETILASHLLVDSVLAIEWELRQTYPQDKQFCYEERMARTINTQCEGYSRAFHNRLKGMVEDRFTKAIHALSSLWYTAWVDAGQPNLNELLEKEVKRGKKEEENLEKIYKGGKIFGHEHGS